MAKKKNNVLDKKVKIEGHKFTIKQLLIIILIIALVGAGFCTYCYFKPFVDVYLLGDQEVIVRKGEIYEEPGWVFTYNFREVDDENVNVTYKDVYNVELDEVNTAVVGTYIITYDFNYKKANKKLQRYVKVVAPELDISLKGGNSINIPLNGSYVDQGITLLVNDKEVIPDSVEVKIKDALGNEVASIDTTTKGTYTVSYVVTYGSYTATATREVVVEEKLETEELSIHFLELGNEYTGDSVYIKAGETDILIDAGSRKGSAAAIKSYVDTYCTDNKLEYVIGTHGDQDHIAGFVGNTSGSTKTGILYQYDIGTIITASYSTKTTTIYSDYRAAIDNCATKGTKVYTAGECYNNENGASRIYQLSENITLEILYNYYYFDNSTSDENNYSVCAMINYGDRHFMFTGDLELEGEEHMAAYYDGSTPEKTLPHVDLFKAGHHGSKTSTNDCLLEKITPDIVCVCCCAGSTEYTANYNNVFPTQDMITRVAKYTDQIYVTTVYNESTKAPQSMNGTILVKYNGVELNVTGSNNTTKLKDTEWFNETVYVLSNNISSGKGKTDFYTAETAGAVAVPRRIWPTTA